MPAAFTVLEMSGGGNGISLVDGVNYALVDSGWAPTVAARRVGTLAGSGPYEDVDEEITVNVLGTTAAIALDNLQTLSEILDVADRWSQGDTSSPALITCQPQGSISTGELQALIIGRGEGSGFLGLPVTFNDQLMIYEISNVKIRFKRRGQWISNDDTAGSISGSPANIATSMSASFAAFSSGVISPVNISLIKASGYKTQLPAGYVLIGNGVDFTITEAESLTATAYTSVADSANNARGGSVLRYTPTVTTLTQTATYTRTAGTDAQQLTFFANVRNNSASATWIMRVRASRLGVNVVTPDTLIDASTLLPRIISLGSLSLPSSNTSAVTLRLEITASTTSGPPTLDIDYIVAMRTDGNYGRVIAIDAEPVVTASKTELRISHLALSSPGPLVAYYAAGSIAQGWRGDAFLVMGSTVYVAWLATNGDAKWNLMNAAASAIENVTLTATQDPAYLVPQ